MSEFGDYYDVNGVWITNTKKNDGNVYLAVSAASLVAGANPAPQKLNTTSNEFKIIANIIRQEGTSTDAQEYLWLAHTANNEAKRKSKTLFSLLNSGYSSVAKSNKTQLSNTNKTAVANASRAAVINVLNGGSDPTFGATLWDGTDFLAWGLNSPDGTPQNKFEEYSKIEIQAWIYATYLTNQTNKYGNSVKYYGKSYTIPASVFSDVKNWEITNIPFLSVLNTLPYLNPFNKFSYTTGNSGKTLQATGAQGLSIFWKTI